ncbi:MAG TPA: hypothetical protein VF808_01660 [Ktedonobacterales bacterium]
MGLEAAPPDTRDLATQQGAQSRPRRWLSLLLFALLAGLIPETIATNSTSVAKILTDPLSLVAVAIFYGTADLFIREIIIRRRPRLAAKVLLGVAFGFVNEGVVAGTWYTVKPDGYAFVHGIDWSWAVSLTVFHLFVSVLIPVYLFDSVMPALAGVPLLRRRGMIVTSVVFVAFSSLAFFAPHDRLQRAAVFLVALALAAIALRLPPKRTASSMPVRFAPGLWRLRCLGFLAMLVYFVCIYLLPALFARANQRIGAASAAPALVANAILLGLAGWALALGASWARSPAWSRRQTLALISGALAFSILVSFLPPLIATWEPLATVPFGVYLIILAWRNRADGMRTAVEAPSRVCDSVFLP